jgi:hypothetical protein
MGDVEAVMSRRVTRIAVLAMGLGLLTVWPARAQIFWPLIVHDPAVTLRNSVTAAIQELIVNLQGDQRQRVERMARRISAFTNLDKYAIAETPEWRIHDFWSDDVLFAHDYHAALNYGDGRGWAYTRLIEPLVAFDDEGVPLSPAAWPAFRARLATINATDAVAIAATNDAGLLRYNGRRDQAAMEALQAQVTDPSMEESATAVLDTISGAQLIAARQRQARIVFIADIVEQLVIDTKRARDTEATALNMQLTTWREARQANEALASRTGDALRTWRQP